MNLTLYGDFGKKKNSTKQPQPNEGTVIDVDLKRETDILNPTFVITSYNALANNINYAKWNDRYYYVAPRYLNKTQQELVCVEDIPATYKADVLISEQLVAFADVANTELVDGRLPTKTSKTSDDNYGVFDVLGSYSETDPTIVINVTGNDNNTGAFALKASDVSKLLNSVDNWFENDIQMPQWGQGIITDQLNALIYICQLIRFGMKQLFATGKAADNIKSAYIVPLPLSSVGGASKRIYLGDFDTNIDGLFISDRIFSDGCDVAIPWQFNDWRNNEPYTELYLYIPYVGEVKLSTSDLIGETSIHVSVSMDKTDGTAIFTVKANGSGQVLGQYNSTLGVPYGIGISNVTPIQTATSLGSAAGAVAGLIAGASGAGAVALVGASALGIGGAITGTPTTISSNGGGAILGLNSRVTLTSICHDTNVAPSQPSAVIGQPYYRKATLGSFSGYVQTVGASVLINGTDSEKDQLNSMLDSGLFIE